MDQSIHFSTNLIEFLSLYKKKRFLVIVTHVLPLAGSIKQWANAVVTPLRKAASYEPRIAIVGIWGDTWLTHGKYGIYVVVTGPLQDLCDAFCRFSYVAVTRIPSLVLRNKWHYVIIRYSYGELPKFVLRCSYEGGFTQRCDHGITFQSQTWLRVCSFLRIQWDLVITRTSGPWKLPCYIRVKKSKKYKELGPGKLPCYKEGFVISDLFITRFHCTSLWSGLYHTGIIYSSTIFSTISVITFLSLVL